MKPILSEQLKSKIRDSILNLNKSDVLGRAKILALYALLTESRKTLLRCEDVTMIEDEEIVEKKFNQLREAKTKKDVEEIMEIPMSINTNGEFKPKNKWVMPEEELLMWSHVSLTVKLTPAAYERYRELFMDRFPEAKISK